MVRQLRLKTKELSKPRKVRNVDGTPNQAGEIRQACEMAIRYHGKKSKHNFFLANIGVDDVILGYPFFEDLLPDVDWRHGKVLGNVSLETEEAGQWRPPKRQTKKKRHTVPLWIRSLPEWADGDEVWQQITIWKSTVAQQLAIQAADKTKRPWQEIVPPQYHKYKIWSEEASERFPDRQHWDHAINLKEDAPATINCRVYPLSPMEKEEQRKFIDSNLRLQRIRRSKSPYASGFFFIKKKDGRYRPVQDYCNLNKWTIPNKYPLPLISDLIHNLSGKKWYTKFDVRWGYNNVRIKEGDEWKAAFKTSEGLFEPTVMFFGLTNSPATFQTMADDGLKEEIARGDFNIYMDDGVIHMDGTLEEHEKYCHHIFSELERLDLYLKPEKCLFSQCEIEYLGMIVGNGQVKMDPVKVQGIADWQRPATVKEVRSFLGFCNFYRAFIRGFSHIARPLNDLTKKLRVWEWTPECELAFRTLKQRCTTQPVLCTPDWNRQFIVTIWRTAANFSPLIFPYYLLLTFV
jgi:hypothetical protein